MGINLGGLVNSVLGGSSPLASLAVSAMTGGIGGLAMEFAKQVISQVAQNVIQDLALPPFAKDMLSDAVVGSLGEGLPGDPRTSEGVAEQVAEFTGGSLADAQDTVSMFDKLMQDMIQAFVEGEQAEEKAKALAMGSSGSGGGGSWVMILAEKLGGIMDDKFEEQMLHIENVAGLGRDSLDETKGFLGIGGGKPTDKAERAKSEMPSATAEMQGKMQEFNMIMNAASNAIKTGGQAASSMASKN